MARVMLVAVVACVLAHEAAGIAVRRPVVCARRRSSLPKVAVQLSDAAMPAGGDSLSKWCRTLGITEDASYDEVMDAYTELVQQAGDDAQRLSQIERARDMILDARLKMRLSGQGQAVRDPLVKPKVKRDWLAPLKVLAKYVERPSLSYFVKMSCIFLGFSVASLISPAVGDQLSFFSIIFAPAFIYNRGMPEPVRDDFGQVGEILPTKPGPAILACLITGLFAGAGYLLAVFYLSLVIPPSVIPIQALCNSMVAFFVWIATCWFKTQVDL